MAEIASSFSTIAPAPLVPTPAPVSRCSRVVPAGVMTALIVIGLPLNMDSSEGPRVQATRAFVRSIFSRDHPDCADKATVDAFADAILALDDAPDGVVADRIKGMDAMLDLWLIRLD